MLNLADEPADFDYSTWADQAFRVGQWGVRRAVGDARWSTGWARRPELQHQGQGRFNDTHALAYNQSHMFARISAIFPLLRLLMAAPSGAPDTVVLAPNQSALPSAAQSFALRADDVYSWTSLGALPRDNVAAPVLTSLSKGDLPNLHTALVLARTSQELAPADQQALVDLLRGGGTVVAASAVAHGVGVGKGAPSLLATSPAGKTKAWRIPTRTGRLVGVDGPVEALFADSASGWAGTLWTRLFGTQAQSAGYFLSVHNVSLLYIARRQAAPWSPVPRAMTAPLGS